MSSAEANVEDVAASSCAPSSSSDPVSPALPPSPPPLKILIKNPTDHPGTEPFTINIQPSSTILQLKELLSSSYPGSPTVISQRLIYAGKLLQNAVTLASVIPELNPSATHTMHLVVSNQRTTASSYTPSASMTPPPTTTTSAPSPPAATATGALPANQPAYLPAPPLGQPPYMGYPFPYGNPFPPPPTDGMPPAENTTDQTAYRAHLQTMERLIAESWQTHLNAAAAAAAAQANEQNMPLAAQLHAHAVQLDAQAAALHAQAHAHARAQAATGAPPTFNGAQGLPQQAQVQHAHMQAQVQAQAEAQLEAMAEAQAAAAQAQGIPPGMPPGVPAGVPGPNGQRVNGPGFGFDLRLGRFPNEANGQQNDPRVRHFVFQFQVNWSLLMKLAVFVYIVGQDASAKRMYVLIAIAIASYMWLMGHFGFVRRIAAAVLPNPRQLIENLFPAAARAQQGGADDSTQEGANGAAVRQVRAPHRFGRLIVMLSFIYSFVYGFICSLLPAWNPEPHARLDELLPWEGRANEPDAPRADAPRDANVQNDGHEHAE